MMSFAENLKKYRKLRGVSRKELAEKLNMKEAGYGFYEQGRTKPDAAKLSIIADVLQVSVNDLLGSDDNLDYYLNTWRLAGYEVQIKDNEIYITENNLLGSALNSLLPGLFDNLATEDQKEVIQHKNLMSKIKGIKFSKEDFISITQKINDDSFAESLKITKRNIERTFLIKALEESISISK